MPARHATLRALALALLAFARSVKVRRCPWPGSLPGSSARRTLLAPVVKFARCMSSARRWLLMADRAAIGPNATDAERASSPPAHAREESPWQFVSVMPSHSTRRVGPAKLTLAGRQLLVGESRGVIRGAVCPRDMRTPSLPHTGIPSLPPLPPPASLRIRRRGPINSTSQSPPPHHSSNKRLPRSQQRPLGTLCTPAFSNLAKALVHPCMPQPSQALGHNCDLQRATKRHRGQPACKRSPAR
ncbi:uncharacterized protein K441DRAFT_680389 [Cenococcum geophilum 1.58]|uniref:uncharacterized protein n=1 Tax=Cenococcum geophilum 1.58 TaxID=794803 RepID=UPI00358E433A|nr:hypothetical protein K441DRAFT_680389 [Cenococcum geophilum 1.58]